nr:hypothetical protein [Streptomyces sp. gCLA4]
MLTWPAIVANALWKLCAVAPGWAVSVSVRWVEQETPQVMAAPGR